MKNKKLFDKTTGILVNAYMKGTLIHADACACAVGNLIAGHNNYSINNELNWTAKNGKHVCPEWTEALCGGAEITPQLKTIGYPLSDILKIERAFESGDWGHRDNDRTGYRGLMAVVDVLIDIHQGTAVQKVEAKELFKIEL